MIIPVLLLLAVGGLMGAARSFVPHGDARFDGPGTTLAVGFVLLAAFFAGRLFASLRLPRLTGYLAAGVIPGPSVLGLLTQPMLHDLRLVSGVAIAFTALTAGAELDLRAIRPLFKSIAFITLFGVLGSMVVLGFAVFVMKGALPFMAPLSWGKAFCVAMTIGVVISAQSPAVVVALRDETGADGPLARTVLGVVVLADLTVIVCFAVASSITQSALGGGASFGTTIVHVGWELFGSLIVGLGVGALLSLYLKFVKRSAALFLLVAGIVAAEVGPRIQLDPLLIALAAGLFVQNIAGVAHRLHEEMATTSLPLYVVFFAVAGAGIHLNVLLIVGIPAAALVLIRAGSFLGGSRLGSTLAGAPEVVRKYAGFGLLPQAGLALALAMLFVRTFPSFGEGASALVLGIVALNEMIAPVFYRLALVKSGEAGKRAPRGGAH